LLRECFFINIEDILSCARALCLATGKIKPAEKWQVLGEKKLGIV